MIDCDRLLGALLAELAHIASNEERDAHDPTWLRGYVAGVAAVGQIAMEFDGDELDKGKTE